MIHTPEQARRKTVIACQTAPAKRGVAVLIVPADISASVVDDSIPYAVHVARPVTRPNDADLAEIAEILSLGGSTMVKQARMLCRAGTPRRHGLWIGRRSPGGIER